MYTKFTPHVWYTPHVHQCTQHVHHMCTTCTPHVHHMFTTFTPHVHQMFKTCTQHVHNIYTTCTPQVHHMYTAWKPHVHQMNSLHIYIYYMYFWNSLTVQGRGQINIRCVVDWGGGVTPFIKVNESYCQESQLCCVIIWACLFCYILFLA